MFTTLLYDMASLFRLTAQYAFWIMFITEQCLGLPTSLITSCQPKKARTPQAAIIAGHDAKPDMFKWMVSIQKKNSDGQSSHMCGGVMIADRLVLTAAHCLYDKDSHKILPDEELSAVVGVHSLGDQIFEGQRIGVSYLRPFDSYQPETDLNYDIGLLVLNKSISGLKSPIRQLIKFDDLLLPPHDLVVRPNANHLFAMGWGHSSRVNVAPDGGNRNPTLVLQYAEMKLLSIKECQKRWDDAGNVTIYRNMVCTDSTGTDICQGDSGGPLIEAYCDVEAAKIRYRLVGIVSLTYTGCGVANRASIYSHVPFYVAFIKQALRELKELYLNDKVYNGNESWRN